MRASSLINSINIALSEDAYSKLTVSQLYMKLHLKGLAKYLNALCFNSMRHIKNLKNMKLSSVSMFEKYQLLSLSFEENYDENLRHWIVVGFGVRVDVGFKTTETEEVLFLKSGFTCRHDQRLAVNIKDVEVPAKKIVDLNKWIDDSLAEIGSDEVLSGSIKKMRGCVERK